MHLVPCRHHSRTSWLMRTERFIVSHVHTVTSPEQPMHTHTRIKCTHMRAHTILMQLQQMFQHTHLPSEDFLHTSPHSYQKVHTLTPLTSPSYTLAQVTTFQCHTAPPATPPPHRHHQVCPKAD